MSAPVGLGQLLPPVDPFPPSRLISALSKLPPSALAKLFWRIAGERSVALCLHRVHDDVRREGELQPWLSIDVRTLDGLVDVLASTRRGRSGQLSLTFDDGYLDALRYVESRAPRYPDVEFLFFVCAEKTVRRRGFRWDSYELRRESTSWSALQRYLLAPVAAEEDGVAPDLAGLADHPQFALAGVEECKRIAKLPNVQLGNHSDHHLCAASMTLDELRLEVRGSVESFRAVFGAAENFAFPFGTPGLHFGATHARIVAEESRAVLWSTEALPYARGERTRGSVVPRVPVLGTWTLTEILGSMVTSALRSLTRGRRRVLSEVPLVPARPASPPAAPARERARAAPELREIP